MTFQRGSRGKIAQYGADNKPMTLCMRVNGPGVYDCTCFGLDAAGKLSDEAYMVFYNQPVSPCNGVRWKEVPGGADFELDLSKLPGRIDKLAFTVSIDGAGIMGQVMSYGVELVQDGSVLVDCSLNGSDFSAETAVISVEIYRKPDWRICAVMRGFNGGLGDLLRNYGGEEETEAAAQPVVQAQQSAAQPVCGRISLEKKLEKAPGLINLAKPLQVQLEKRNLQDVQARVALVMDMSGSMRGRYGNGTVQAVVNKTLPLAVQFDDDGNLDFWYYGNKCRKMEDVTLANYEQAVPGTWKDLMHELGGGNNEPVVMREVLDFFAGTELPVYVLFVTDGGVANEHKISKLMREASEKPIFWQFVGVGGRNYGVMERLDSMEGRYVDNAGFFALDDFMTVPDGELYGRLLDEFPKWLAAIRNKNMIRA